MHHRLLPQDLRERVRRYDQYKWLETRGVDEFNIVQNLPKDLRRDIKRHLCLGLVKRVIHCCISCLEVAKWLVGNGSKGSNVRGCDFDPFRGKTGFFGLYFVSNM